MKKRILFYAFLAMFPIAACDTNDDLGSPEVDLNENPGFQDGFETLNLELGELFPLDGSRWTNFQQVNPTNNINELSVVDTNFSEGSNSIRFLSYASDTELSKIDIEKDGMRLAIGSRIRISADFYISGNQSIENLLIMDLECCSCWDPNVGENFGAENQCPGIRLIMSGSNGYLSIERGKISGTTLQQTSVPFPRDQWVNVSWEMTLSDTDSGTNRLLLDGVEVINEIGMNMPNAEIFRELFATEGIDFNLQEPVEYERVQVGATANPTAETVELFVDNFSLSVIE